MLSDSKSQIDVCTPSHPSRPAAKCQRPTALLTCRNRSESPATRSKSRPSDIGVSPPADESARLDFESLQKELELKSGVLKFGNEIFYAKMDDFINEGLLGSGTCSSVFRMRHHARVDLVMAVKYMRRSSTYQEENKRIMMDLNVVTKSNDCAFIVECYGIFFTMGDVWICMEVMPTCLDKLLHDLHRPFPEKVVGKVTVSITTALDYLKRKHNVMHRDVKPSNMLLGYQGVVKLCDFGISGKLKDSIARSRQLGCIGYMAPERLETPTYDVRADIWSLGISLLELATGSFPYKGTEIEFAIMSKIIREPPPSLPHHIPFTEAFRYFIDCCLRKDHRQRPKYRSLMSMEFYCRHNVAPYDVWEWLKGLPLKHLHHSEHCLTTLRGPPLSPTVDSPKSTATLSPDMTRALHDMSLEDSFELKVSESSVKKTQSPKLDVVLIAAPSADNSQPVVESAVKTLQSSCKLHTHIPVSQPIQDQTDSGCSPLLGCQSIPNRLTNTPHFTSLVGDIKLELNHVVPEHVLSTVAQPHEPPSLASSGYGSGCSDGSPASFCSHSRPSSAVQAHESLVSGENPCQPSRNRSRISVLGENSAGRPIGLKNDSHRVDESPSRHKSHHWNASPSCTTKYTPAMSPNVTAHTAIAPLIRKFEPHAQITNRFGFAHLPENSVTADRISRCFTPPATSKEISGGDTKPDHMSRSIKNTLSSSRSSSVGSHLQRTPAQRWTVNSKLGDKSHNHNSDSLGRYPVISDHRLTAPNTDRLREPEYELLQIHYPFSSPPVPPHFHRRRYQNTSNHVALIHSGTPPSNQCGEMADNHLLQTRVPVPISLSRNNSRLAHRLHTHPIPRHGSLLNSAVSGLHHNKPLLPLPSQHHAAHINRTSPIVQTCLGQPQVGARDQRTKPPEQIRISSRSSSQPAIVRMYNWQSFETDL